VTTRIFVADRSPVSYDPAVHIRELQAGDVDAVTSLNNENIPAVNAKTAEQMADMLTQARWAIGAFAGESAAGETVAGSADAEQPALLGFMLTFLPGADYESMNYAWFSEHHERFAYMDRIVVDPNTRGGGIGAALYGELFELVGDSEPFVGIDVNVRPPNEGSIRFHERLGFAEIHRQDTDDGNKTVALMVKHLP